MPVDAPTVSVIITTYNRADLVPRALDSVLRQTHRELDIIVVDDGSTDSTPTVLERFARDPRVRIIRHPHNRGVTAAKNTGLGAMKGAYGTFLDSDDELLPDAVKTLVDVLEKPDRPYALAFGDCVDARTGIPTGGGWTRDSDVSYRDVLLGRMTGEHWGLTDARLLGSVRLDERVPGHEWVAWHRLFRGHKARYVHQPLRRYYRDASDRITRSAFDRAWAGKQALGYRLYVQEYGRDLERLSPRRLARLHQTRAFWLLLAGDRLDAFDALETAWRLSPGPLSAILFGALFAPPRILQVIAQHRKRGT